MRFVASTFLSVAILAFVTQSVSAEPPVRINNVEQVDRILKRDPLDILYEDCLDHIASPEECIAEFGDIFS